MFKKAKFFPVFKRYLYGLIFATAIAVCIIRPVLTPVWNKLVTKMEESKEKVVQLPFGYGLLICPKSGGLYTILGARFCISGPGCYIFVLDSHCCKN